MRDSIFPRVNVKSSDLTFVSAGLVGTVAAIQLCTDWNPLGRCFVFWKQLRGQVSHMLHHVHVHVHVHATVLESVHTVICPSQISSDSPVLALTYYPLSSE
jgi:hypothetical protein